MSSSVVDRERRLYEDIWSVESYSAWSPGESALPMFLDMAGIPDDRRWPGSVLDAGCGSGKGTAALMRRGFRVTMCDLTDAGLPPELRDNPMAQFHQVALWDDLRPVVGQWFDYVYCCDVMEHIPPQYTMLVVSRLLQVCRKGVFLNIAFVPDSFGVYAGESLHKSVFPFTWWRDSLSAIGNLTEGRDLLNSGAFYLEAK